jgi:hypothetical protein
MKINQILVKFFVSVIANLTLTLSHWERGDLPPPNRRRWQSRRRFNKNKFKR